MPRPIIKLHLEEKVGVALGRGSSPKFWSPPLIFLRLKLAKFKFGRLLEFAKAHHKIPPRRKEGRNPKLGELPKIGFSLDIYAMAESIDFKFGT